MSLIVLSNREPYSPSKSRGKLTWKAAVGGLTAALDPVLSQTGGTWIAWGENQKNIQEAALPAGNPSYTLQRLALSKDEVEKYYHGFANRALWPMSHYFLGRTNYSREEWLTYKAVNQKFADAAISTYKIGDIIWVHDYQLALVPQMIREALPQAKIGFFWHIPWPSPEIFRTLPQDREILQGILGADLIGFHTDEYCQNFKACCRNILGLEAKNGLTYSEKREIRIESWPIGIEFELLSNLAASSEIQKAADEIRNNIGTKILLGVDRLDYTKGIPERLAAFNDYLNKHPEVRGQVTFIQIAVPSREQVSAYRQLKERVELLVGRINGAHSLPGWNPVHYFSRSLSREQLAAYYRAADVMLVTPLRDGLNLVAKEFAAISRHGALILSEFAGAAAEMPEAILVNPYDYEGMAFEIQRALEMPVREKIQRLNAMKRRLRERDIHSWAQGFLSSLKTYRPLKQSFPKVVHYA